MPWMFTSGWQQDKNKMIPNDLVCTWKSDCPSHKPYPNARKPKLRIIERIQPHVFLIECKYCGMRWIQDTTGERGQKGHENNEALLGGVLRP